MDFTVIKGALDKKSTPLFFLRESKEVSEKFFLTFDGKRADDQISHQTEARNEKENDDDYRSELRFDLFSHAEKYK